MWNYNVAMATFPTVPKWHPGVNVIKVLHLYFTRVANVSLAENNSYTCKLQVQKFVKLTPGLKMSQIMGEICHP